jgi:hypothetical protein
MVKVNFRLEVIRLGTFRKHTTQSRFATVTQLACTERLPASETTKVM